MRINLFLRRFTTLSVISCALAACQMSADSQAVTEYRSSKLEKNAIPLSLQSSSQSASTIALGATNNPSKISADGSLTMETAVQRAIGWHPAIEEVTGHIYQADERIRSAQAGYYPKVSAGVNSAYRNRNQDGWRPKLEVSASQLLYDFGKVSSSVDTERAGKKVNEARLLLTIDNLARDTASAVNEVQRFHELVILAEKQVEGVKSIAALVKERTDGGASTLSDQVQADARVESALATQWQFESELNRWQSSLASLIGINSSHLNPAGTVPTWLSGSCDIREPDWTIVPAILEAEAQKEEAGAILAGSKADALPTISLEASTGYDLNNRYSNASAADKRAEYSVGLNVSSSLYNGGQTSAQKRAAGYALQSAEAAIQRARYDAQRNLLESQSQIGTLDRLLSTLRTRTTMMITTRDLYRDQYIELGTRTLLDLLNAEQELHQAEFQIANVSHDINRLNLLCTYNSGKTRQNFHIDISQLSGRIKAL